jgi:hypothetical protein
VRNALAREIEGEDVSVGGGHFPGLRCGRLWGGGAARSWTEALTASPAHHQRRSSDLVGRQVWPPAWVAGGQMCAWRIVVLGMFFGLCIGCVLFVVGFRSVSGLGCRGGALPGVALVLSAC